MLYTQMRSCTETCEYFPLSAAARAVCEKAFQGILEDIRHEFCSRAVTNTKSAQSNLTCRHSEYKKVF